MIGSSGEERKKKKKKRKDAIICIFSGVEEHFHLPKEGPLDF